MPNNYELKLPEMGEGIDGGDVVSLLVAVGDQIEVGQGICELETSKALIEVPSPVDGKVAKIMIAEGDAVAVGAVLVTLSGVELGSQSEPESQAQTAVASKAIASVPSQPTRPPSSAPEPKLQINKRPAGDVAPAGPATRRIARELGVDPMQVPGSGPEGRITKEDVQGFVKTAMSGGTGHSEPSLPDFSIYGDVERVPPTKVKSLTAEHMVLSSLAIPHVTQFEDVDITELEALRKRLDVDAQEKGGRLTLTVIVMKALVPALKSFPMFNASRDPLTGESVYKRYYNFGIATATVKGLVVPVISNVDQRTMIELALDLSSLALRVRDGKVQLSELAGGSFSISNQGSIGGGHFTPIVNHPESAILGLGRSRTIAGYAPGKQGGEVSPRTILPLALSYDHRICDGAEAAGFIRLLKESLEDPGKLLLGL